MVTGARRQCFTLTALMVLLIVACGGHPDNESLLCKVIFNHMMFETNEEGHDDAFYACHPVKPSGAVSGQMFLLDLPDHISFDDREHIHDGEDVFLSIPGGTLSSSAVIVPNASAVKVVEFPQTEGRRNLRKFPERQGILTILPLRIITKDSQPDYSADKMYELIFEDEVSLNRQMRQCSFGKFGFVPTKYKVLEVYVDMDAAGSPYNVIQNAADAVALDMIDEDVENIRDVADLIMFIIPPGTDGGWAAFGNVNGVGTVFNNRWAAYPAALMHEVGHNLGMFHANEDGSEYGDVTGVMGSAPDVTGYPQRCFNAQNFWHLGWYEDRSIEIDPVTPALWKIAAFVDYNKTVFTEYVGVKVRDLYIQYNRATSFNKETGEKQNMLTVVRGEDRGTDLIASLDRTNPITLVPLEDGLLSIQVCNVVSGTSISPDSMIVSIGFGSSICPPPADDCPGFGCAPQLELTEQPTPAPTASPVSEKPSPIPTVRPFVNLPFPQPTPPPAAAPADTFSNIFVRTPPTVQPSPASSPSTPSAPSVPSTPSATSAPPGSSSDEMPTPSPVAPPQPSVSSIQSSADQRNRRMRLAFIVMASAVFAIVLAMLCCCCINRRCQPKKVYRDVEGADEEVLSLSSKDHSRTDSSISSESSPSPPVEEMIVTGVVANPIAALAADAWRRHTATWAPQPAPRESRNSASQPAPHESRNMADFFGGSLRVIGSGGELPGGSRTRNMSPVSPVLSDQASARSYGQPTSAPRRIPDNAMAASRRIPDNTMAASRRSPDNTMMALAVARLTGPPQRANFYLDDDVNENVADHINRVPARSDFSFASGAPRTTDIRRSMATPEGAVRLHRASVARGSERAPRSRAARSNLYYDERVPRSSMETPAMVGAEGFRRKPVLPPPIDFDPYGER